MPTDKSLKIGYHTNIGAYFKGENQFDGPAKAGKGVDFILCHIDPEEDLTVAENCERCEKCVQAMKDLGVGYIANFESQNFIHNVVTKDGYDWANRPDGTHCLNIPKAYMDAMNSGGNCWGVMYDEFEHTIINRNISLAMASKYKVDKPVFPVLKEKNVLKQGELLRSQLEAYRKELSELGAATLSGEHVFPVLFHMFAENGIIPNFKSQKESTSNIQFAVAAGAAMEYKTPLWNCVDLWYRLTFPGHSVKEMEHNLQFAYLAGVDAVYVEAAEKFYEGEADAITPYGEAFCRFADAYKGKPRAYNVQDYEPEIGIIHYDDTYWGQGRCRFFWRNMLFGNPKLKVHKQNREWIRAFRLITHGENGRNGICWSRLELRSLYTPHRSFATMNNAVVFDEKVKAEQLQTLKLAFLCGETVSDETAKAVADCVKNNGLTVVTTERFAPAGKKAPVVGFKEYRDGKGTWIVTKSFEAPGLKKRLAPFLGNKNEMRFVFAGKELIMKISKDGESFEVVKE